MPLPQAPTLLTLPPAEGDATSRIQSALDAVGALPPDANGVRGAVALAAGEYLVGGTLFPRRDGVVLRGAGDGADPATNTVLRRTGANQLPVVVAGRTDEATGGGLFRRDTSRDTALVTDAVVPIGAYALNVDRPELFAPGDPVVVLHPATKAWLAAVDFGGTDSDPGWDDDVPIALARTVVSVDGPTLTLDAPTFSRLDASLSPPFVYHRDDAALARTVGLEDLRVHIETAGPTSETHARDAVRFVLVEDAWARGVTALHAWRAGIGVHHSRYVTVAECQALEPHSLVEGVRRYNFEASAAQLVLFRDNRATEARRASVGNGTSFDSGIVFLDNVSENAFTSSEAHQRWGTGFLWDNHTELGSASGRCLHLGNRGSFGTGHGWACAHCVAWNADMNGSTLVVEKPPTAQNYAIGTQGEAVDDGPFLPSTGAWITDLAGLTPRSLYLRRVEARLATAGAPDAGPSSGLVLHAPVPNPATVRASVRFGTPEPGPVRLAVLDTLGREVRVGWEGHARAGVHAVDLDLGGLAPGVYVVRLQTGRGVSARRLTVVPGR